MNANKSAIHSYDFCTLVLLYGYLMEHSVNYARGDSSDEIHILCKFLVAQLHGERKNQSNFQSADHSHGEVHSGDQKTIPSLTVEQQTSYHFPQ